MRRTILAVLYLATLAALGALAWRGREYYELPLAERPRHELHWQLKPGGEIGRLYGIGGASLMTAMLSYSARKRIPFLRRAGTLSSWLDFHIWCGVTGPLLIVLHSALKIGGLIAIAFWSMVAVALSGILGRFLYAQIPRTAAGDQLSLDEARRLAADLEQRLRAEIGGGAGGLDAPAASDDGRSGVFAALAALALEPLRARARFARFRRAHPGLPRPLARRLRRAMRQSALLERRIALWRRIHELFHYWHVFHKPFAILMYLFAAVHIGVAFATGYGFGTG
ncbi:MAG: hypothetical protein AMXMBFR36_13270 [Acidobacteriota bacterium]